MYRNLIKISEKIVISRSLLLVGDFHGFYLLFALIFQELNLEGKKEIRGCYLCNSKENLNVHYKTYEYRGEEYLDWRKSLIVLCDNCHKKFQDKIEEIK